jgi:hypothetical protein
MTTVTGSCLQQVSSGCSTFYQSVIKPIQAGMQTQHVHDVGVECAATKYKAGVE